MSERKTEQRKDIRPGIEHHPEHRVEHREHGLHQKEGGAVQPSSQSDASRSSHQEFKFETRRQYELRIPIAMREEIIYRPTELLPKGEAREGVVPSGEGISHEKKVGRKKKRGKFAKVLKILAGLGFLGTAAVGGLTGLAYYLMKLDEEKKSRGETTISEQLGISGVTEKIGGALGTIGGTKAREGEETGGRSEREVERREGIGETREMEQRDVTHQEKGKKPFMSKIKGAAEKMGAAVGIKKYGARPGETHEGTELAGTHTPKGGYEHVQPFMKQSDAFGTQEPNLVREGEAPQEEVRS